MGDLRAGHVAAEAPQPEAPFVTADPLITALGPIRWAISDDEVTMVAAPSAVACNAGGFLHGGALSAWLDMAMYELAKRCLGACVTISMDVNFLAAAQLSPLSITGRFLRSGRSVAFLSAEIVQSGQNIAAATAIYKKSRH